LSVFAGVPGGQSRSREILEEENMTSRRQFLRQVAAAGGLYYLKDKITTPDVLTAHFEFARCPVTWRHHIWGAEEFEPDTKNGIFFYGEQETVFVTDNQWTVIPRGKGKER